SYGSVSCSLFFPVPSPLFFFLMIRRPPRSTLFPSRRSSDLGHRSSLSSSRPGPRSPCLSLRDRLEDKETRLPRGTETPAEFPRQDRKSTRLNSSHVKISYAVFCLKKKKTKTQTRSNTHYEEV